MNGCNKRLSIYKKNLIFIGIFQLLFLEISGKLFGSTIYNEIANATLRSAL